MWRVKRNIYATYRKIRQRLRLPAGDSECKHTLQDRFQASIKPLTDLFATTLERCQPSDAQSIFDNHNKKMFISDLCNRSWEHSQLFMDKSALFPPFLRYKKASAAFLRIHLRFKAFLCTNRPFTALSPSASNSPPEQRRLAYEIISWYHPAQFDVFHQAFNAFLSGVSIQNLDTSSGVQNTNANCLLFFHAMVRLGKHFLPWQ